MMRMEMGGNTVRVNITLPAVDLAQLDRLARQNGTTRSGMIRQLIHRATELRIQPRPKFDREAALRAVEGMRQLAEKAGDWDGVAEIRRSRDQGYGPR